jgi:Flp pilus assembly pilin Flp
MPCLAVPGVMPVRRYLSRFLLDEDGATSIEYSLIAAFIFLAIINVLQTVSVELTGIFGDAQAGLQKRAKI